MLTSFTEQIKYSPSITSFISHEKLWINRNHNIYIFSCNFRLDQYQQNLFDKLGVIFPSDLSRAVSKRQAEFLAGRYAAKEAMQNSNIDKEAVKTVGVGPHRCPIWPDKFIGSITHNKGKAICAVTGSDSFAQLGIDFQSYISNTAALQIEESIHSNDEKKLLVKQGISSNVATTIIFSAKESIFKALYPKVKKYFGFEEAIVEAFSVKEGCLVITISNDLVNEYSIANLYMCYFRLTGAGVFTFVYNSDGC